MASAIVTQNPGEPLSAVLERYLYGVTLQMIGDTSDRTPWLYRCYEHLVWELGRVSTAQALPKIIRMGEPKKCYANTLELIRTLPTLTYTEGFAWHAPTKFAYLHAWATDRTGRVWDRTWADAADCAYFGIPFDRAEVERFDALGEDYLGIIASQYLLGNPLMRTGQLFPTGEPDGRQRRHPRP